MKRRCLILAHSPPETALLHPLGRGAQMECRAIRAGPGRPRPAPQTGRWPAIIGLGRMTFPNVAFLPPSLTSGVCFRDESPTRYGITFGGYFDSPTPRAFLHPEPNTSASRPLACSLLLIWLGYEDKSHQRGFYFAKEES